MSDPIEDDKRRFPRIQPFVAPCHVSEEGRRYAGYLTDLSLDGGRVICTVELPPVDSWVVIEARLGRRAARQPFRAHVRWARVDGTLGPMFGVTFESLDDAGRRALMEVVDEFQRTAAELHADSAAHARRQPWTSGPDPRAENAAEWLALSDDELLFRIEALPPDHAMDEHLMEVVRSTRHFFIRQEAAKQVRDHHRLKEQSGDRHIGQILVRGLTRAEDVAYLERLIEESRHIEVRKAAEAQLKLLEERKRS